MRPRVIRSRGKGVCVKRAASPTRQTGSLSILAQHMYRGIDCGGFDDDQVHAIRMEGDE